MGNADLNYGQNNPHDHLSEHNVTAFAIARALRTVNTATICKVVKCTTKGEVGPIGRVDVLPLVDMQDGIGRTSHHVNVQSLPYLRMQGGSKAIILDPKPGDLALVVFADRDISAAKKNKKQSAPGSRRRHNMADGMYVGTLLADAPTSYIRFDDDGTIEISPDNGTTLFRVKAGEVYGTPDKGTTWIKAEPNKLTLHSSGLCAYVQPKRIDLGKLNAAHAVMTEDGPSTKVFAVIDEDGP